MKTAPTVFDGRVPSKELAAEYRRRGYWVDRRLTEYLESNARNRPDDVAVVDRFGRLSNLELLEQSRRLARGLTSEGVRSGDIFLVQLPNWAVFSVFHMALTYLGAITVNIPITYRTHELETIIRITQALGIVVPGEFRRFNHAAMVRDLQAQNSCLRTVVVVDGPQTGATMFGDLLNSTDASAEGFGEHDPDDVTLISFTSGTTGEPKGVMHSSNSLGAINNVFASACGLGTGETILMAAPLGHSIGLMHGVRLSTLLGVPLVLQDQWDAGTAARLIEEERATFTVVAPPLLYDLIRNPLIQSSPPRTLRLLLCGGSYLPEKLMKAAAATMVHTTVSPLWGMTEGIGSLCGSGCPPEALATTDGMPVPGSEFAIQTKSGQTTSANVEGELLHRSPTLFHGYFKRADLNHEAFTDSGYFRTGDLAIITPERFLRIRGRVKELIIRGGVNISPSEIERVLIADERIAQIAVVGAPDERLGERICAFVVPAQGAHLELEDLMRLADQGGLSKQKWPEMIRIVSTLPTTATGKISRRLLVDQLGAKQATAERSGQPPG